LCNDIYSFTKNLENVIICFLFIEKREGKMEENMIDEMSRKIKDMLTEIEFWN